MCFLSLQTTPDNLKYSEAERVIVFLIFVL